MSEPTDVLCAGIVVADHVCTPIPRLPAAGELVLADRLILTLGGCAANAAVSLVKMGVAATVLGRVGDDAFGRIVAEMLREHGVNTSGLRPTSGTDTSQTLIVNVAGQDRRFIHTFGANATLRAADIPTEWAARCRVLYLGGYLAVPNVAAEDLVPVFRAARAAGARTILDVVVPGPGDYRPRLEPLLPHVDVFMPNSDEAALLTGDTDPLRQTDYFRQRGAQTVVITMGGDGALLVGDGVRLRAGVYPVPFLDASGSGDAFSAGYMFGLLQGFDPEGCLKVASALGASCVRAIGTTPGVFTRAECEAFMREHSLQVESV